MSPVTRTPFKDVEKPTFATEAAGTPRNRKL